MSQKGKQQHSQSSKSNSSKNKKENNNINQISNHITSNQLPNNKENANSVAQPVNISESTLIVQQQESTITQPSAQMSNIIMSQQAQNIGNHQDENKVKISNEEQEQSIKNKEGLQQNTIEHQKQSQIQQNNNNNNFNRIDCEQKQQIVGSGVTGGVVERKGILKNAQMVYSTDSLPTIPFPLPSTNFKNQKHLISIDKLQKHIHQSHLHHHYPSMPKLHHNRSNQDQAHPSNNFSINISTANPENQYTIYTKIQNAMLSKSAANSQQPILCGKEGIRSNQEIQRCMNQYIQSKLAKKQAQLAKGESDEIINFQYKINHNLDKTQKQQEQLSDNINKPTITTATRHRHYKKGEQNLECNHNHKHEEQEEDDEEDYEDEDEDYELCEELEEDCDDEYEEEEEEIEEDIDEEDDDEEENDDEEEEDDDEEEDDHNQNQEQHLDKLAYYTHQNNCLQSSKFLNSSIMDVDGLKKRRSELANDKKNDTIIVNIKAQKKCQDEILPSQQNPSKIQNECNSIKQNNNQLQNSISNNAATPAAYSSSYSSSSSSTSSSQLSKEGVLASQILKEKYQKKLQQEQNKHSQQLQKQIDSINNMYADSQEFKKQIQLQHQHQLFVQQQQKLLSLQNSHQVQLQFQINSSNPIQSQSPKQNLKNQNNPSLNPSNNINSLSPQVQISNDNSNNNVKAVNNSQKNQSIQKENKSTENIQGRNSQNQPENNNNNTNQQRAHAKIIFSSEIKNILDQLDHLNYQEKKKATMMREQDFNIQMQNMIDCVGCKESLQRFLSDLIQQSNITQKSINLDGIMITKNKELGIIDNLLENNFNIASFLQYHCNKQSSLENLNKNFSLFKKSISQKNYRCNLHSKKPIPCLWKDNFEQLFDPETLNKDDSIEIDESLFLSNLDKYLKKRKFCVTCKENIMGEYQKLKENVEMNQQEQYINEEYDPMMHDEDERQIIDHNIQLNAEDHDDQTCMNQSCDEHLNNNEHDHHNHSHGNLQCNQVPEQNNLESIEHDQNNQLLNSEIQQDQQQNNCLAHAEVNYVKEENLVVEDDDQEYEDEIDEEDDEDEEEDDEDEVDLDDDQYDLISCIKYCNKTKKISIPMQVGFIQEIMSKAQIDTSLVKHANTTEAAQDELLICLGQTLKDKLQAFWKNKKSEEIVRQLFLNICFRIFMAQLQGYIQMAMERQGCKNSLEEYLEEDERAKEAKKIKSQKKKQKQKLKKQEKKQEEQKKQMEEEIKKKQEEEQKLKMKQEAKLLKKQQEELLQKQKQLEEEQKKQILTSESKKKRKNKKGSESQQSTELPICAEPSPLIKENIINQNSFNNPISQFQLDQNNDQNYQDNSQIINAAPESNQNNFSNQQNLKQNQAMPLISAAAECQNEQKISRESERNNQNSNISSSSNPQFLEGQALKKRIINIDCSAAGKSIQEREIYLLKSMGWDEQEQTIIIDIPQIEINNYSLNKKKYDKQRAFYRKNLNEKFLQLIKSNKSQ